MLKQTPLNALHRALGAKMTDFGGWEMPLHYGSQIEEHHRVRRDAGMFDVSHMLAIDVQGADAQRFLSYLLANNVAKLAVPGKALYSCMLNPAGGVLDDLIVYFFGPERYRLVVNAGTADKDLGWMTELRDRQRFKAELLPRRDLAMLAVQGPQARSRLWAALPGAEPISAALEPFHAAFHGEIMLARTGYTGEDGFEVLLPAQAGVDLWRALLDAGVAPCGLGARDTLRLEAGMNLYGQDMDESVTPLESGLGWTVDLAGPRDFCGKAALLESRPERRMVGLLLMDRGVLRPHQRVRSSAGEGEISSGTFSPTLSRSIALARVPSAVADGETVMVEVRDKQLAAKVVRPPFVRNGRILV